MIEYIRHANGTIQAVWKDTTLNILDMGKAYKFMDDVKGNAEIAYIKKELPKNPQDLDGDGKPDQYKYDEDIFIKELQKHVDATYMQHYGGQIQPIEFVMSNATSLDHLRGNVIKYTYRFGAKDGSNPADLFKAAHYLMMMLKYSKEGKK